MTAVSGNGAMGIRQVAFAMLAALVLGATPARPGQPIYESLVDCAALYTLSNRMGSGRDTDKSRALLHAGKVLTVAAIVLARQNGVPAPDAHIIALTRQKVQHWDARGTFYVFSADFRDWTQYCVKLSNALGLELRR